MCGRVDIGYVWSIQRADYNPHCGYTAYDCSKAIGTACGLSANLTFPPGVCHFEPALSCVSVLRTLTHFALIYHIFIHVAVTAVTH